MGLLKPVSHLILPTLLVGNSVTFNTNAEPNRIREPMLAAITRVLEQTPETPQLLKIRMKLMVHTAPEHGAHMGFFLYPGMEIKSVERKKVGEKWWLRFEIQGQSYWLDEEENSKAHEKEGVPRGYKIVIKKADRRLVILTGNGREWQKEEEIPIGLGGRQDTSPKRNEWDGLTPEGTYYVAWKNPVSAFGKNSRGGRLGSLYLSYPNAHDAWIALQEGRIDRNAYQAVSAAIERKQIPPKSTGLGYEIMIHGGGASDWTAGCVALDNEAMEALWKLLPIGTPVEIEP